MRLQVWDNRKSECFAVTAKIRIETLSGVKTGRLRCWSFSTRKLIGLVHGRKQNESNGNISLCASGCESSNKRFLTIVESVVVAGAFCQRAFERLEPCAVKVASTVLRGERRSNTLLLPDLGGVVIKVRLVFLFP